MPENNFQKLVLFWGEGANGKDVTHHVYRNLVGVENCTSVNLYQLTSNRFATAGMDKKMLNTAGEVEYSTPLENTGVLKQLRGEAPMTVEHKNKRAFQIVWTGKCFFNANKFPKTTDDTMAFYRSWQIQQFSNVFNTELGNVDTRIKNKLVTEKELAGLFNVVVDFFLPILLGREGFTFSQKVGEIEEIYKRRSDSAKVFIEDMLIADSNGQAFKAALRAAYEKFVTDQDLMLETEKSFRQTLNASGLPFGEHHKDGERFYSGIRLKTTEELEKERQLALGDAPRESEKIPLGFEDCWNYYLGKQNVKLDQNNINNVHKILLTPSVNRAEKAEGESKSEDK